MLLKMKLTSISCLCQKVLGQMGHTPTQRKCVRPCPSGGVEDKPEEGMGPLCNLFTLLANTNQILKVGLSDPDMQQGLFSYTHMHAYKHTVMLMKPVCDLWRLPANHLQPQKKSSFIRPGYILRSSTVHFYSLGWCWLRRQGVVHSRVSGLNPFSPIPSVLEQDTTPKITPDCCAGSV